MQKIRVMTTKEIIEKTISEYIALNLDQVINYEKMRLYSIVANSTALEGSTLTKTDTQLLLDEGITAKGKPMLHHLMVQDNYKALQETLILASRKTLLTPTVLQKINGINMANTGEVVNSALGTVDGTKGEFRKVQAFSEALGYYYAPQKIQDAVDVYCEKAQKHMTQPLSKAEALKLSFEMQATLIIIHPWQDGNKRTSRLISNYVQKFFDLPIGEVSKEDSVEYLQNLKIYKDTGDIEPFVEFMSERYVNNLSEEMKKYKQSLDWELPQKKTPEKSKSIEAPKQIEYHPQNKNLFKNSKGHWEKVKKGIGI